MLKQLKQVKRTEQRTDVWLFSLLLLSTDMRFYPLRRLHPHASSLEHDPEQDRKTRRLPFLVYDRLGKSLPIQLLTPNQPAC